jgi:hypothetical protein
VSAHFLGSYLLGRGLVTQAQIDEASAHQEGVNRRLGDLAVEAGLLTPSQVEIVLATQRATDLNFGALAVAMGFVSRRDMDALLFRQHVHQVHLGEALLVLGHLTPAQFSESLDGYCRAENERRASLDKLFEGHCGRLSLQELVASLERAFLRFARCPLKAHRALGEEDLADLPYRFTSELPGCEGIVLRFCLHLDETMVALINKEATGRDTPPQACDTGVMEMIGIIGRYLRKTFRAQWEGRWRCDFAPEGEIFPSGDCLRLLLACPRTRVGLSIQVLPAQATA